MQLVDYNFMAFATSVFAPFMGDFKRECECVWMVVVGVVQPGVGPVNAAPAAAPLSPYSPPTLSALLCCAPAAL